MKNKRMVFRRIMSFFLASALCITMQDMAAFAAAADRLQMEEDTTAEERLQMEEGAAVEERLQMEEDTAAADFSEEALYVGGNELKAATTSESVQVDSVEEIQKVEKAIVRGLRQGKDFVGLEGYQVTAKKMETAFMDLTYRFPQYFVSGIQYESKTDTGMVTGAKIQYSKEASGRQDEMKKAAAEIVNTINSAERELEDYEKAWLVSQWLARVCEYDGDNPKVADISGTNPDVHTAYGALVNKKAQSDGYSAAYQYIMRDLLNVPCLVVKNNAGNHVWNMVKIDGKYYHVDVTWSINTAERSAAQGDYFLLTDAEIKAADKTYHSFWNGPYDVETADGSSYEDKKPLWMREAMIFPIGIDNMSRCQNSRASGIVYYEGYYYFSYLNGIYRVANLLDCDITTKCQRVCEIDAVKNGNLDTIKWVSIYEYHDCLYFNGVHHIYRLNLADKTEEEQTLKPGTGNDLDLKEDITNQVVPDQSAIPGADDIKGILAQGGSKTYIYNFKVEENSNGEPATTFLVQNNTSSVEPKLACYVVNQYLNANIKLTGVTEDPLTVGQKVTATATITSNPSPYENYHPYYRWYRDGFVICRNTTGDYTTTEEDIGKELRVVVTCDNFKQEQSETIGTIPKQDLTLPNQLPTGITGEKGSTLKNIALPEGFEWKNPDIVLDKIGKQSYPATYCPDSDKYNTIDGFTLEIEVQEKKCDHSWGSGKITTPAKCETKGERTFTCSKCGETKTEEVKAKGHSWNSGKETRKATCSKTGIKEFTCKDCAAKKTEDIEKTSHTWNTTGKITKEPTAKEKGTFTTTCSKCGTEKKENLLYGKTGNYTSGITYVNVRSSAKNVNSNNIIGKLKKDAVIRIFETGSTSTWTKICYENRAAYIMSKYVIKSTESANETPADETVKTGSKVTSGKVTYKVTKNNTVEFTSVKSSASGTITIPASVKIKGKSYKVTSVAAKAMKNNKKVKKVVIGSNVTKIGAEAFSGCKNLKNITIKSSKLKSVGKNAIKNIYKKATITCPKKKKAAYKKLFKSSTGYKKTMKIK